MKFIVGIDLGTTHSALASVEPRLGAAAPVVDFPVTQLVGAGEVAARPLLPSTLYVPLGAEFPPGALRLPWGEPPLVVGELARWQGAQVPGRLIASAKSWLCHPGVDRSAPILPWAASPEVTKISPVDASAQILEHLRHAWDAGHPEALLAEQEVVLTVPASFDEAARALTVNAARKAGLGTFTLLEEPQAAFYDYTARHRQDLAKALGQVRLLLVVDVGGGTTDFTLVHAGVSPEGPVVKRLAVGEHLMLGGDNMDAALAHRLEQRFAEAGKKLGTTAWTQLVQLARTAKEALLGANAPERHGVSLVTPGSRLFGSSLSGELTREEAEALVLEGFFPAVTAEDLPRKQARMALQELGLPYAHDPAITRHAVAFLRHHALRGFGALHTAPPTPDALPRPDAILLNGGVFNAPRISETLVTVLSALWPDAPRIPLLRHDSLERAVARGAAYYGLVRKGMGLRIGGGAARAFYVGVGGGQALCLIPRGFEEGESITLEQSSFSLLLGKPVQVQLYSTTADRVDGAGDVITLTDEFQPLPPIHTLLTSAASKTPEVSVHLAATLTEIGTLELYCVSNVSDERWRLEFELRGISRAREITVTESMPARFAEARESLERVYGHKPMPVEAKDVKNVFRALERVLGPRESWRVPVLRELWSTLFAGAAKRRRTPDHERAFFQVAGYSLRPGFGYPLDAWRAEQMFGLFKDLVSFHAEKPNWIEFWVMWRRMAGGLAEESQRALYAYLRPHLERRLLPEPAKPLPKPLPKIRGIQPEGLDEMVRTAASLEHLAAAEKVELGGWIVDRMRASGGGGGPWAWSLGRLGARVPLYGSGHRVVPIETASAWVELLLSFGLDRVDGASFAVAQLARQTGDRSRDLDEGLRATTLAALQAAKAPESFQRMVAEVMELEAADEARALGDTLPAGLRLG